MARCPTCGQEFVWTVAVPIDRMLRCTNKIRDPRTNKEMQCPQKYTRADWEYIASRQREGKEIPV